MWTNGNNNEFLYAFAVCAIVLLLVGGLCGAGVFWAVDRYDVNLSIERDREDAD